MKIRETINEFWSYFNGELSALGYGGHVASAMADKSQTDEDAMLACSYMKGLADGFRREAFRTLPIGAIDHSAHAAVHCAAEVFLRMLRDPMGSTPEQADELRAYWRTNLRDMIQFMHRVG